MRAAFMLKDLPIGWENDTGVYRRFFSWY